MSRIYRLAGGEASGAEKVGTFWRVFYDQMKISFTIEKWQGVVEVYGMRWQQFRGLGHGVSRTRKEWMSAAEATKQKETGAIWLEL